jgi:hypothetical protein
MNATLVAILDETLRFLRREGNDFLYSSWHDAEAAEADIQEHVNRIQKGDYSCLFDLQLLYAPTGDIQEVSVRSGWGDEFLALAARFDRQLHALQSIKKNGS